MKKGNKKYILRFNAHNPESVGSFRALRVGTKKVETRAATAKYKRIVAGDTLVFVAGKDRFEKNVCGASLFRSIDAMLKVYRVGDIMPGRRTKKELAAAYYSYSGYKEKIKKFGLVAWEVK